MTWYSNLSCSTNLRLIKRREQRLGHRPILYSEFNRHWSQDESFKFDKIYKNLQMQVAKSSRLSFFFCCRVSNNSELQGARNSAKKRTKKRTIYFPPKRAIFLIKGAHFFTLVPSFLTPSTIFIAFLCMNFLEVPNFAKKNFNFP